MFQINLRFLTAGMSKKKKNHSSELEQRIEERTKDLYESEALLRGFIDGSADAICIRDLDRRLILWNEAFARGIKTNCGVDVQVGMRAEDYIQEEVFAQFDEQRKLLYPAIDGESTQVEYAFPCKDGETSYFDVRWIPVSLGGEIIALAEITRDITEQKITYDKLRHSDEIFKGYMESSIEAIHGFEIDPPMSLDLSVDEQLDYLYDHACISVANAAWARQAGYEKWENMIGLRLNEIVPRSDPENVASIRQIAESNYHLENFITHDLNKQGELQTVLNNHSAEIKNGHLIRTWGTHRDITELEAARQKLREAEERYRTVADFTYDWEYWENPEGEMLYVSPSCERISGYEANAFLDNSDLLEQIIDSEDVDQWKHHRHDSRARTGSTEIEFRIHTKEGEIRWIEHACQPVYDEDGKFLGIRASNRDITSRKKVEEKLKKKDQFLEDAQRIAHLGSWNWNIITNVLVWSDEVYRIFGLSQEEFGATYDAFLERVHPDDRDGVKYAVEQAFNDPNAKYNIAHRIVVEDGSERIVRERGNVIFGEDGKPLRMLGTVQDITDIRLMEAETRKLRSEISHLDRVGMMGVLSAGISHEINQPLTAILSNAQAALRFLDKDQPDIKEVKEALQDIVADNKRAGEIVHSIRNIVGDSVGDFNEINLTATVRGVMQLVKSELLERKISLAENLQQSIPTFSGNRVQIQQVILNLLMNAMDAVTCNETEFRKIMISTNFTEHEGITLRVSDSGSGIKTDQFETIFDSFRTNKTGGLGIGLSICKSIAEKHDGEIWAENSPEGGAVFIFKLPYGQKSNA
jgi:PAS domain S-box-containing protein